MDVGHLRSEVLQNREVVLAAIHEDACLYLVVAQLGIVVHVFETHFRHLIHLDVLRNLRLVVNQRVPDVDSQRQTDVAVGLGPPGQQRTGHRAQTAYQTVVFGYLLVVALQEGLERQLAFLEVVVLLRGLVAGVGEVKHVVRLLRIEHQRVLVRTGPCFHDFLSDAVVLLSAVVGRARQLVVTLNQFVTEYNEGLIQILLFQNGLNLH